MRLLMVLGMLEVLVVLEEMVVIVGVIIKKVEFPTFFGENYRIKKKNGAKTNKKSLK